ncbi:MAG: SDR family oxidoreductase [Bacteroidota bacterium]
MQFKNKTALVTGASSGIGKSFAYLLAAQGCNLVLVARSMDKLKAICQDLQEKHGITAMALEQDLSVVGSAQMLFNEVNEKGLSIDLLINNAGFGKWGAFEEFSLTDYFQMIHLNITSLTELSYLFLPRLKEKPEAGIINVGSTASLVPVPYSAVYGATKAYVLSLTEALLGELADTKVQVHCLCPAGTNTNFAKVASGKTPTANADMKSPDQVAKEGLDAFQAGKHYVITGRKFALQMLRLFPRRKMVHMITDSWKKRIAELAN